MKLSTRGWGRDMGTRELVDLDLSGMPLNRDPHQTIWSHRPGIFRTDFRVNVAWKQELNKTGNYRMEASFTSGDVARLFRAMFGTEVDADTLERCGLTLSADLKKQVLSEIKLADLTLGDLAGLTGKEEKPVEEPAPKPQPRLFRRP